MLKKNREEIRVSEFEAGEEMRVSGQNIYQCGWVNEMQLIKHFDLEESLRKSGKCIIQAFYLIR